MAVLAIVVAKFPFKVWELVMRALNGEEADIVLGVLSLVDLILIANLVVMVIISGYENFVSHVDTEGITDKLSWFGKLDAGSIKIKLASSIVAISSIHLLQRFLEANTVDQRQALRADGACISPSWSRRCCSPISTGWPTPRRPTRALSPGGKAALALWVDIDPADDFGLRALAQPRARAGAGGLSRLAARQPLQGRRPAGALLLFYDAETAQALESDAYYARLRNPSEMSRAVFPKFRDTWRTICTVEQRWGDGVGAAVLTLRMKTVTPRRSTSSRRWKPCASTCSPARPMSARRTLRKRTCGPRRTARSSSPWSPSSGRSRPPRPHGRVTRRRARSSRSGTPCRRAIFLSAQLWLLFKRGCTRQDHPEASKAPGRGKNYLKPTCKATSAVRGISESLQPADRCDHRVDFVRVVGHVLVDVPDGAEKLQGIHSRRSNPLVDGRAQARRHSEGGALGRQPVGQFEA